MSRGEHIERLRQGVSSWNAWRRMNPDVVVDLTGEELHKALLVGANLGDVDFTGATLIRADLRNADLTEADLTGADLTGAILRGATLTRAILSEADLRNADLTGASLSEADLRNADLTGASLSEADLRSADLTQATLTGTDLSGADLTDAGLAEVDFTQSALSVATLTQADLTDANFSGVDLIGVNLTRAILTRANFTGARVALTIFGDVDLSDVVGLESVVHRAASTVGTDTLIRSRGKVPEIFLRGCGVSDILIEYLPSLIGAMQPIQFYSCFISYSSEDDAFARRLHERMRAEYLRVWFAPEDLKGGKKVYEQVDHAIQVHDRLLLVLSEASIQSEWVLTEIRRARKHEVKEARRKLFPIRLCSYEVLQEWECFDVDTKKDLAAEVREYFIPDFSTWKDHDAFDAAFTRLLSDLRQSELSSIPRR